MSRSMIRIALVFVALLVVLTVAPDAASPADRTTDAQITNRVRSLLRADFRVRDDSIEVTTSNGWVTLKGDVTSALDRHQAEQLAKKVHLNETDLETYYQVNKDRYVEDVNDPNMTQKRQRSFDEVRQQVAAELLGAKRRDIQQQYIEEMMEKYKVIIHSSAFGSLE